MAATFSIDDYKRLGFDDCNVKVGRYVTPDGWNLGNCLEACDWDGAEFLLPTNNGGPITAIAVNVKVTGRTVQSEYVGSNRVRVRIEFIQDGGESIVSGGWMAVGDEIVYSKS